MNKTGETQYKNIGLKAHEWCARLQDEQASQQDREALRAWLAEDLRHEEAYGRAQTYWAAFDHLNAEDIDPALMPPQEQRAAGNPLIWLSRLAGGFLRSSNRQDHQRWYGAGMAAVVVVFAAFFIGLTTRSTDIQTTTLVVYSTGTAETKEITLADGSIATLGASTEIEVSMSDSGRSISLITGAALFDVQPDTDRPFSVIAGGLTATAIGTQFDVRSNGGILRVAVAEGEVSVSYPLLLDGEPSALRSRRTLKAGEQVAATVSTGLQPNQPIPAEDVGAWKDNRLVYIDAPLAELIADANRYSERAIVLAPGAEVLADETLTAAFDSREIGRMLRMITLSFPLEIDESQSNELRLINVNSSQ